MFARRLHQRVLRVLPSKRARTPDYQRYCSPTSFRRDVASATSSRNLRLAAFLRPARINFYVPISCDRKFATKPIRLFRDFSSPHAMPRRPTSRRPPVARDGIRLSRRCYAECLRSLSCRHGLVRNLSAPSDICAHRLTTSSATPEFGSNTIPPAASRISTDDESPSYVSISTPQTLPRLPREASSDLVDWSVRAL
jgi:hypothetical protein